MSGSPMSGAASVVRWAAIGQVAGVHTWGRATTAADTVPADATVFALTTQPRERCGLAE